MHHRRNPNIPLTTRGTYSRIVTIRLPYDLEKAIKDEAKSQGKRWQTFLKELLEDALGLSTHSVEVKRISAKNLRLVSQKMNASK